MIFEQIILSALAAGFFGSLHCAGMCGGIATALGMGIRETSTSGKPVIAALFFQIGRISSYVVAGFIAGSVGDVMTQSDALKDVTIYLRIFSAVFMIGLGLFLAGWFPFFSLIEKVGVPVWKRIAPLSQYLLPVKYLHQAYAIGFLWGWIPCGLTYSILLWAIASGSAAEGGMLMLAFGIGTLPAMLPLTLGAGTIHRVVKLVAVRVIAGLLIITSGLYILQLSIIKLDPNNRPSHTMEPKEEVSKEQQHNH